MKTLGRIAIILAAAGIICAGFYWFANNRGQTAFARTGSEDLPGDFQGDPRLEFTREGSSIESGTAPNHIRETGGFLGVNEGPERDGGRTDLGRGLIELGKDLVIVAGIIAGVAVLQQLWRWLTKRRTKNIVGSA